MLAFRDYHSLIEVRRYVLRFMMHDHSMTHDAYVDVSVSYHI